MKGLASLINLKWQGEEGVLEMAFCEVTSIKRDPYQNPPIGSEFTLEW